MSTNYNLAGKTLIVDKITEVKGSKVQSESDKKSFIANACLLANYTNLKVAMASLADDNYLTSSEKIQIKRDLVTIDSTYASLYQQSTGAGFDLETSSYYDDFNTFVAAYTTLKDYLDPLLADMNPEAIDGNLFTTNWTNYYNAISPIEQDVFAAIYNLTDQINMTLSSEFFVFESDTIPVPDQTIGVYIIDKQQSSPCILKVNGIERSYTDHIAEITPDDFNGSDEIILNLSNDTQSISKTIKKVFNGEDSVSVQIYSTNGDKFREGTANTILKCYVFQGSENITDNIPAESFNWTRISSSTDALADDRWNTSSKAIGKKIVEILPEDTIGRTNFSCEVEI